MDNRRDMPEHLLFEILLWLSVTSLLRFKSVCKSWYTLIDSPVFISQHFDYNSGNDNLLGVCVQIVEDVGLLCCLLSDNKYKVYNNFDCGEPWHVVKNTQHAFLSNGIICLEDYDENIFLWNPTMKQLRSLPKSTVHSQDYVRSFIGFGFNVKSNDHNFVRTTLCKENISSNQVEVYSLRADSWRTMHYNFAMPNCFYNSLIKHITKDGTCFWIASGDDYEYNNDANEYDTDSNVILSFDLNEKTYGTMPLPVGKVPFYAVTDFLGDKLAYINGVDHRPHGHLYYEIWVLHEYGVKESWNKAWKIGSTDMPGIDNVLFPLRFISNGEFLLLNSDCFPKSCAVYRLYDLGTEENEYFELHQTIFVFGGLLAIQSPFPVKRVHDAHTVSLCPLF